MSITVTEEKVFSKVEATPDGMVNIREEIVLKDSGGNTIASKGFYRRVIAPGDDYSNETASVKALCEQLHTQEAIYAYSAKLKGGWNE